MDSFKDKSINSFHLAEGPGGFIEAFTYIRNNNKQLTIYKSVGHALSDLAAARLAYKILNSTI